MRIAIVVIMMLFLESCAIFGAPTELDDTKGLSPSRIYEMASEKMADRDFEKAIGYLKKLETRFPNSKYAAQSQLDMAYAYYKKEDAGLCVSTAERFIKFLTLVSPSSASSAGPAEIISRLSVETVT